MASKKSPTKKAPAKAPAKARDLKPKKNPKGGGLLLPAVQKIRS